MNLGLKKDEVKIVPFDYEWKNEFNRVKKQIQSHVGMDEERIEYIGSTAIVGMPAKPIIDILLGVEDLTVMTSDVSRSLKKIGFYRLRVHRPDEVVFAKFKDETFKIKTHIIHVVTYKQELWNNLLFFRDDLNANEHERQAYLKIKQAYAKEKTTGIKEYTDFKEEFVRRIFAKRTHSSNELLVDANIDEM